VTLYEDTPRLSEFLGELSFSGYRELGFQRLLLVEGPTDVRTVKQFLRILKKDHLVVPLPLGGRSMINGSRELELEEIKRICENVTAIIDSERTVAAGPLSPERQAFVASCVRAGVDCHVLERRATENYLSDAAVKKVNGATYRALGPYEALRDLSPTWAKTENWRIAQEMSRDELITTDLGTFLQSL